MSRNKVGYEHDNMVPYKASSSVPRRRYRIEIDGICEAYGDTVPADATTGYAPGCQFQHVDGSGILDLVYFNIGTVTSAKFRPIAINSVSGTAAGAGPSPLIWDGSLWAAVQLDPTLGYSYWNDFLGEIDATTGDGWTITTTTSGALSGSQTEDGGALFVDSAGNTGADDGIEAQLGNCLVLPIAGRTIRFEARVKMNDTSANISQFFVGLAGIDTSLIDTGVVDDVVDKAAFFRHAGSTGDRLSSITARTTVEDITVNVATTVDDTWIKLGIVIDGVTSVKFYVDGVLVETGSTANTIPNAVMCLSFVAKTEGASKDAELSVDWVRLLVEGTRSA